MEQEMLKLILVEVREMKGDISELKTTVKSIDKRLTNVEHNVAENTKDIKILKEIVAENTKDIKILKENVAENAIKENSKNIKSLKELVEFQTENINAIKHVVTSHYMEFKKFVKANATQHNLYDAKLLQFNKDK